MSAVKRIGILTGGGDAPGLNPAIKGVVYRASGYDVQVVGLYGGWRGLLNPLPGVLTLDRAQVRRWDRDGGTNLGSTRTNPFSVSTESGEREDRSDDIAENITKLGLDAIVACGGEDTLGVAARLSDRGQRIVGVPKTIDKDLNGTDYTLGFDTALRNVTDVIERSRTPAGSHGWVQIIEVMGRHSGHLAFWSGVAGQADLILIPEHPFRYTKIFRHLRDHLGDPNTFRHDTVHPHYSVIVVAEGAYAEDGEAVTLDNRRDAFGHVHLGGIGEVLACRITAETPYEARSVMLGHPQQRGGPPSAIDRIMGLMFGAHAADAIVNGHFGKMVCARGLAPACEISLVDLGCVLGKISNLDVARYYDTERYHMKSSGM